MNVREAEFVQGRAYLNVDAGSADGRAFMDGATLQFAPNAAVDVRSSVGYKFDSGVYCVAPIVDFSEVATQYGAPVAEGSAAAPAKTVYYAGGRDCCGHRGDFKCGPFSDGTANLKLKELVLSGSVVRRDADGAVSQSLLARLARDLYRFASHNLLFATSAGDIYAMGAKGAAQLRGGAGAGGFDAEEIVIIELNENGASNFDESKTALALGSGGGAITTKPAEGALSASIVELAEGGDPEKRWHVVRGGGAWWHILSYDGPAARWRFLGAENDGSKLALAESDDGSGLFRWRLPGCATTEPGTSCSTILELVKPTTFGAKKYVKADLSLTATRGEETSDALFTLTPAKEVDASYGTDGGLWDVLGDIFLHFSLGGLGFFFTGSIFVGLFLGVSLGVIGFDVNAHIESSASKFADRVPKVHGGRRDSGSRSMGGVV